MLLHNKYLQICVYWIVVHLKFLYFIDGKDKSECISKWRIVRISLSLKQSKYRGDLWGILNKYKTIFWANTTYLKPVRWQCTDIRQKCVWSSPPWLIHNKVGTGCLFFCNMKLHEWTEIFFSYNYYDEP